MAGLYIHVPFCVRRCVYCDFFSSTEMRAYKGRYLSAVREELEMQKDYLGGEPLETVYFGGGTPSQLSAAEFGEIFETIYRLYPVAEHPEVTLEANPDDMTAGYVAALRPLPFNRISMGVQSFRDADLRFLNRRHDRAEAVRAVALCKDNGFTNISIDLIYGLPGQTLPAWEKNLEETVRLDIPHVSAYHLTYEEGTQLYRMKEQKQVTPVDEELSLACFNTLIDRLAEAGFTHYEISNFAREGFLSRHNSAYWTGRKYLGIGPSAHSYNGELRQWNASSLPEYLKGVDHHSLTIRFDYLTIGEQYNDYIITRLRTMWGIDLPYVERHFGEGKQAYCLAQAAPYIRNGLLLRKDGKLLLSRAGIFLSDAVMRDLLWI